MTTETVFPTDLAACQAMLSERTRELVNEDDELTVKDHKLTAKDYLLEQ
jgi:hypothetical protein